MYRLMEYIRQYTIGDTADTLKSLHKSGWINKHVPVYKN